MIAFIDGIIAEVREGSVVVQAGSFGLELFAPKATLMNCKKGAALRLHTYLVVKEDLLALYGFHDEDARILFTYLIGVSGVGPKLALALLSSLPNTLLAHAILQGDAGMLSSAPGVGKKMAERIILELKTKLPEHLMADGKGAAKPQAVLSEAGDDAVQALLALGYRESHVKVTIAEIAIANPEASAEMLIRKALAKLK